MSDTAVHAGLARFTRNAPDKALPPLRVITLMTPPPNRPYSAETPDDAKPDPVAADRPPSQQVTTKPAGSVTSGKNFPATGPLGPWIVTHDEIGDPKALVLTTRLNGQQVQHSTTDLLIYSVAQIIAFCSDFTPLAAGDIIATGTPEGVGHRRNPPLWMKPGDVLEVEISGIGVLRSRVVEEPGPTAD